MFVCNTEIKSRPPTLNYTVPSTVSDNESVKKKRSLKHMFMHFSDDNDDNSGKYVNWTAIFSIFFCDYEDK
jgi:hypothetical protein